MNTDPELPVRFAHAVLEELGMLRGELASQRSLIIELLSRTTHEPRRQIKERTFQKRKHGPLEIARGLKEKVGLESFPP